MPESGAVPQPKTVLVTGGTVRLGRAIAEHLRRCGHRVLTTSSRADAGADIVADFREPLGAAKCYAAALKLLGGVPPDAVVNNAALFTGSDADLEAVNLTAPKKLTMLMSGREVAGRGAVVNILDATSGTAGVPERTASAPASLPERTASAPASLPERAASAPASQRSAGYVAAKAALRDYTRTAAVMFSDTLRVNAVSPGPVAGLAPVGARERAEECPLGRPHALDVAKAVAFLIDSESVTGLDLPVDGGLTLTRSLQ